MSRLETLASSDNEWAKKTLESLKKYCPTSLKLTFAQIQKGKDLELSQCFEMVRFSSYLLLILKM